jgi:hypothetical protein
MVTISTTEAVSHIQSMDPQQEAMALVVKKDNEVRFLRFKRADVTVERMIADQRARDLTVFDVDMKQLRRLSLDRLKAIAIYGEDGIGLTTYNIDIPVDDQV